MSGMKLSIGVEVEAFGAQAAVASHQFYCKSREKPSKHPYNCKLSPTEAP